MCGRYGRRSDKQHIAEHMRVRKDDPGLAGLILGEDYNIAPSTFQPIVRNSKETLGPDGRPARELVLMRWGLVPYFAKDLKAFSGYSTINARAESIQTTPTFRSAFQRRRGIAPMDFFYEWLRREVPRFGKNGKPLKPTAEKLPFVIRPRDGGMFGVACVWDAWHDKANNTWLQSFAVVTCEANELMSKIHNRMPVILHERDYERWLDREGNPEQPPVDLLRPYDSERMEMVPCNPLLNHVKNNGPEMLVCPNPDVPLSLLNSK